MEEGSSVDGPLLPEGVVVRSDRRAVHVDAVRQLQRNRASFGEEVVGTKTTSMALTKATPPSARGTDVTISLSCATAHVQQELHDHRQRRVVGRREVVVEQDGILRGHLEPQDGKLQKEDSAEPKNKE
jgi:hypothetical protein